MVFPFVTDNEKQAAFDYLDRALEKTNEVTYIPKDVCLRSVKKVGVVGAGTMGGGIAMSFANTGFPVVIVDNNDESLSRGLQRICDNYEHSLKKGKITESQKVERIQLIDGRVGLAELSDCDLVIEAVYEDMDLKKSIFQDLDKIAAPGAILATNTSGLDINEIASSTSRPSDVIGAHFFSPAHVQKLLEIVRCEESSPEVVATLMDIGRRIGKVTVLSEVYPGFIGNSLFRQYIREAHFLVEEGCLPHEVDDVLKRFGFSMGVFEVHDMAGNDVGWQMRKKQMHTRPQDRRWNDLILELCDMGRMGQKTGKGWYYYDEGSRVPNRDPDIEEFIIERSSRLGIGRRKIDEDEILKRCLYSMINEGAKLLENKVALRASDIDVTFITGYGFPKERGGPMYFADQIGLSNIYKDVSNYYQEHGYWWKPSGLLEELSKKGARFSDYF